MERVKNGKKKARYLKKPADIVLFLIKERVMEITSNNPNIPSIQNLSMLI